MQALTLTNVLPPTPFCIPRAFRDGNFVIYASSEGAVWASGSNEERRQAQSIAIIPSGEDRHGARIELRGDGRLVWGSRG